MSRKIEGAGWVYEWGADGTLFVSREKDDPEGWLASQLKVDVGVFLCVLDRDLARIARDCELAWFDDRISIMTAREHFHKTRVEVEAIRAQASTLLTEHFNPCPNNKRRRSPDGTHED